MKAIHSCFRKAVVLVLCLAMLMPNSLFAFAATEVADTETEVGYFTSDNWIHAGEDVIKNSIAYFRKEHTVKGEIASLSVKASAHNHLKFYVNSNLITGYVSPAPASLPEDVNYLSYRFSGAELDALLTGDTVCFAAACQYMGSSGTNYKNATAAFWAEITLEYADGSKEVVNTDSSWRALQDTPYKNNTPSVNIRKTNAQLDYDAQKMPDPLAWTKVGYDEASYTAGTWQNAVSADAETKTWKMREQAIPEGAVHKTFTPKAIGRQEAGWQVFDVGQLVTGWVRIKACAPAGTQICIRYSEYLTNGDTEVAHCVGSTNQESETYCDYYTFSGNGEESFAADFDYKAFRYFEVTGLEEMIPADALSVEWVSTDTTVVSKFSSSDPFLQKLFDACINTQINNIEGMPVDCPHREQAQYLADSQIQYALISYALAEYPEIAYKTLNDFAASQKANGRFSFTAPTEEYESMLSIPEWDLRYTAILKQYLDTTGDRITAARFYDNACRNVNYFYAMRQGVGLLKDEEGAWNISDHPAAKGAPDDPGSDYYLTAVNLLLYDSCAKLSEIATVLGKTADAAQWAEKASGLKTLINAYLVNPETGLYYDHSGTTTTNEGLTAMAINVGVAESAVIPDLIETISQPEMTDTSIVLTFEMFRAILDHGNTEQKEYVYNRLVSSWGPMVTKGHGTVWESFKDHSSHSHAWSAYPAYYMLKDFLGVEFENAGNDISVVPYLPSSVDRISGEVAVPGSDKSISVYLEREDGYKLSVTPPEGKDVLVAVPRVAGAATLVKANGRTLFQNGTGKNGSGITYVGNDAEYVYFKITADKMFVFLAKEEAASGETVTLSLSGTEGGTVTLNGSQITLPYSATVSKGSEITLSAVAADGYEFKSWIGSAGCTDGEFTVTANANLNLTASFEAVESKTDYKTVTVTAPEGSDLIFTLDGNVITLPATLRLPNGTEHVFAVNESEDMLYSFLSWKGAVTTTEKSFSLTVTEDTALEIDAKSNGTLTNVARNATVTSNSALTGSWAPANLTDGNTTRVSGSNGASSKAYTKADISADPHYFQIDLGGVYPVHKVVIYPRTDLAGTNGECTGFPTDYKLLVSEDGTTFQEAYSVTDGAIPATNAGPVTLRFEAKNSQYVKLVSTKLGSPDQHGSYYVQLYEMEVYSFSTASEAITQEVSDSSFGGEPISQTEIASSILTEEHCEQGADAPSTPEEIQTNTEEKDALYSAVAADRKNAQTVAVAVPMVEPVQESDSPSFLAIAMIGSAVLAGIFLLAKKKGLL